MKDFIVTCTAGCDYEIEAAYYKTDDGFITFKDEDHSPVASFVQSRIVCVRQKPNA